MDELILPHSLDSCWWRSSQ